MIYTDPKNETNVVNWINDCDDDDDDYNDDDSDCYCE